VVRKLLTLAFVPAALGAASAQGGEQDVVGLRAVRYARSGGQTLVDGFCRVPFTLLDRLPGGTAAFRVAFAVRDSAGLQLYRQSWAQSVPDRLLQVAHGSAVEHFTFAIQAGRYDLEVTVTDSATGRVSRRRLDLHGFTERPTASDLLLATGIRAGSPTESPLPGEIRKGSLFLQASGWPALTPQQAALGYYLELYGERSDTVSLRLDVRTAAGATMVRIPEQRVPVDSGGRVTRGLVDLAGLPPGSYQLVATTQGSVERSAAFDMRGFEVTAALAAAAPERPDRFTGLSEARLDSLYGPLIYLMAGGEQGIYSTLSPEGKVRFLRTFWAKRDPTAATPRNEAEEDFYARIATANRDYREGGAAEIPGWRTDRGRVFITHGPPDEVLARPQASSSNPYVVWKYTRGRPLKYVFLDQTQFGNYVLIYTDDRRELSRPNWQALLGPEAVVDVERF
jgi:GWxTD domain-containing protein